MALDIFNIEPNVVSTDMKGYSLLFYGGPKVGKTSLAAKFPNALIAGFEKGWSALAGVKALPLNSWTDFTKVLNQLKQDAKRVENAIEKGENASTVYDYVVIDVADIAYDYCEKYVCQRNGVNSIREIPFGAGYKELEKEFDERLRSIVQMGYGLIIISHEQVIAGDEEEGRAKVVKPTMDKRALKVCSRLVDVYANLTKVETLEGTERHLILRSDGVIEAGSRFPGIAETVRADYASLEKAINDSIHTYDDSVVVDAKVNHYKEEAKEDFETLKAKTLSIMNQLVASSEHPDVVGEKITEVMNKHLGVGNKLSETTSKQYDLVEAIFVDVSNL